MKIVVINLERSLNRRALMQENLERLGLEFEFFPGIDASRGEHLSISRHDERASILDHGRPLSIGEIGCFASHYLVWQRCVKAKEPLVILEDDVMIAEEFPRALSAARELLGQLHLIRLGIVWNDDQTKQIGAFQGFEIIQYSRGGTWGLQGYLVSPEAAANLVTHAAVWSLPVDLYLSRDERHGFRSFGIYPLPVTHADQSSYPTVIGTDRWEPPSADNIAMKRVLQFLAARKAQRAD
jgi:glycosyl transferase family 25